MLKAKGSVVAKRRKGSLLAVNNRTSKWCRYERRSVESKAKYVERPR